MRAQEPREWTWIFYRGDGTDPITSLYVVALDSSELSVVRVEGRLDQAVALALAEHPGKLARKAGPAPN